MAIFFLPDRRVVAIVQGTPTATVGYAFRDTTDVVYVYMFPNAAMKADMTLRLAPSPWNQVTGYPSWLAAVQALPFPATTPFAMYGSGQTLAGAPQPWPAALEDRGAEHSTASRADVNTCHDDGWYKIERVPTIGSPTTVGWLAAVRNPTMPNAPNPGIREGCCMSTGYTNTLAKWQNVGYRFTRAAEVEADFSQLQGAAAGFPVVFNTHLTYKNIKP